MLIKKIADALDEMKIGLPRFMYPDLGRDELPVSDVPYKVKLNQEEGEFELLRQAMGGKEESAWYFVPNEEMWYHVGKKQEITRDGEGYRSSVHFRKFNVPDGAINYHIHTDDMVEKIEGMYDTDPRFDTKIIRALSDTARLVLPSTLDLLSSALRNERTSVIISPLGKTTITLNDSIVDGVTEYQDLHMNFLAFIEELVEETNIWENCDYGKAVVDLANKKFSKYFRLDYKSASEIYRDTPL
ncbi:hypothetical protein H6503_05400 [Candidatus Woesearchaeota archaeon]|nr:hypothetical protein [Candidatus Woesearchaeota archaeon]